MNEDDSVSLWIELARAGDAAGQQALWDRYFPALVRLAKQRLQQTPRRMADEEDVALSALKSFFRGAEENRFPNLRGRDELWRLLSRMTYRKAIDHVRHEARRKRGGVGESAILGDHDQDQQALDQLPGTAPTPLLEVIVADECRRLLGCLKPELQRIALLKLDGFSNQEIAEHESCSVATVERRLKLIRDIWAAS